MSEWVKKHERQLIDELAAASTVASKSGRRNDDDSRDEKQGGGIIDVYKNEMDKMQSMGQDELLGYLQKEGAKVEESSREKLRAAKELRIRLSREADIEDRARKKREEDELGKVRQENKAKMKARVTKPNK